MFNDIMITFNLWSGDSIEIFSVKRIAARLSWINLIQRVKYSTKFIWMLKKLKKERYTRQRNLKETFSVQILQEEVRIMHFEKVYTRNIIA